MAQSNKLKIDTEKCRKYDSKIVSKIPVPSHPSPPLYASYWKQTGVQTIFQSDDLQKYCKPLTSNAVGYKKLFHVKGWPFLTANLPSQRNVFEKQKTESQLDLFLKKMRPEMKDVSVSVCNNSNTNDTHTKDVECLSAIAKQETDIKKLSTTNRLLKLELTLLTDFINLGYEAVNVNSIVDTIDGNIQTSYKLREIVLTCVQYCKSHGKRIKELKEMEKKYEVVQKILASNKAGSEDVINLDHIEGDTCSSISKDERGYRNTSNTVDASTEYSVGFGNVSLNYLSSPSQCKTTSKTEIMDTQPNQSDGSKDENELTEYGRLKRHVVLIKTLVNEQEAMVRELSDLADELGAGKQLSSKDLNQ